MSRESYYYHNVHSETAYMSGIAEAMISQVDMLLSKEHLGLWTDMLWIGDKGMEDLYGVLLRRLRKYNAVDKLGLDLEQDSFMPNIPIVKVESTSVTKSIVKQLRTECKAKELEPLVTDFFFSINWYLGLPKGLYRMDMETLREFMPELEKALSAFYAYIVMEVYFVEYEGYVLMLLVGSSE